MKKFFSFIVVLMFIGTGFAQHNNTVTQTGDGNTSTVDQELTGSFVSGNTAVVLQENDNNESDLLQKGNNYANVWQRQLGSLAGNDSWLEQIGDNDAGIIQTQGGNKFTGHQDGFNWLRARQNGVSNIGEIIQVGSSHADLYQFGNLNVGSISQDGAFNNASTYVYGYSNSTTITQDGDDNKAFQVVGTFPSPMAYSNSAILIQNGNSNYSLQNQQGTGNSSTVTQTGNGNFSYSYQN